MNFKKVTFLQPNVLPKKAAKNIKIDFYFKILQ
jgi:hypothetical protein